MSEFRRFLYLGFALLLAGCVEQPETDQNPPGILAPPVKQQQTAPQAAAPAPLVPRLGIAPIPQVAAGSQVALLLPLTGRQSAAATSVRDGFLTAYYSQPAATRPGLRIYDTGQMSITAALNQATQDGAGIIVGPLTREEVAAAAAYTGPRPPMLTLNALAGPASAGNALYQYALSPEDEVLTAFTQELNAAGGQLLDVGTYDSGSTDYAAAISQVLRINESEARDKRLESVLGTKLTFQPRRRGDVAFIFTPGQAQAERLLRPQLKFYFAGDVPAYATADAFEPDSNANQDLDGLIFPDAPWLLGGALVDGVRDATNAAWPTGGPRRNILFAFGFDAARLATALRALSQQSGSATSLAVDGLTGHLTIGPDGHVLRDLMWAQIRNGEPRLLN